MKTLILLALLPLTALAQSTVTIPQQTLTFVIPARTLTVNTPAVPVTCTPPQTLIGGVCTSPVVIPPPTGTFWVYHAGQRGWTCDVSYGDHNVNYQNVDATAPGGIDIAVIGETGFQPDICSQNFDTTGYTSLIFSIKPTQPMTDVITGMMLKGDTPIPNAPPPFQIGPYCTPKITVGAWSQCKIPLSAYGLKAGQAIYKFMIQRQTPAPAGQTYLYYVAEIGFIP